MSEALVKAAAKFESAARAAGEARREFVAAIVTQHGYASGFSDPSTFHAQMASVLIVHGLAPVLDQAVAGSRIAPVTDFEGNAQSYSALIGGR